MNKLMMKLYLKLQALREEHGQDMIEYILVGGVVALGAVAGMQTFANRCEYSIHRTWRKARPSTPKRNARRAGERMTLIAPGHTFAPLGGYGSGFRGLAATPRCVDRQSPLFNKLRERNREL